MVYPGVLEKQIHIEFKIKLEITGMEMKRKMQRINETKSWFFGKISIHIVKFLVKLNKTERNMT